MVEEGMGEFLQKMQSRYEELTGMKADDASDIGVRLKILAEQLAMLKGQLEEVKRQTFAQTACGEALERHAAARGLSRKPASFARGEVVFSRTVPAAEDIVIPKGTPLTGGSGQLRFVTVQEAVLAGDSGSGVQRGGREKGKFSGRDAPCDHQPGAGNCGGEQPEPYDRRRGRGK